ncbi:MAG: type II toxin-antitoxin system HicB family antitoxin [Spirochaetota bacterium]|nr:type II toxin-antitoxin system HicB family antitoxin [Spirochaetota bacterium]
MNTLNYKGYTAKIEFDPDDDILFGNLLGIRDTVGFHGETVNELKQAFHEAVDFYLESCEKAGREPNKPFSGKFMVRVNSSLHNEVAIAAANAGKSLNKWVTDTLQNSVHTH